MRFYRCHVGIVMTNNYFTQSAKDLAKENGIVLWDRDNLLKFLNCKYELVETINSPINTAKYEIKNIFDNKNTNINNPPKSNVKTSNATMGQSNALAAAKDYFVNNEFSYKGLIEQLKYDGYTKEEAAYAADNCNADWNKQAVKSVKKYLETTTFSKSALIEQLEYDGFTHEQAVYGVEQNGY